MNVYANGNRAAPLWAVLGAPLVGVPLMGALLALTAPAQSAPADEVEAGARTEQVGLQALDQEIRTDCTVELVKNG